MSDLTIPAEPSAVAPAPVDPRAIIGVRFLRVGKLYHFDATGHGPIKPGDRVIVETTRGRQLGEVAQLIDPGQTAAPDGGYKAIEGIATARDLAMQEMWRSRETEAMIACRERAHQLGLDRLGIKVVKAEYSYDGSRLTYLLSGPDDEKERFDTRSLRDDMQKQFPAPRVALRQIGPRDVAKLLGGMGACGLETRCCSMFLTEFSPVSIKMAKEQGLSLNPEEITGMCGRLRCCLVYEYEQYVAARQLLPKRNKRVTTPKGTGKVVDLNPLKETIFVEVVDGEGYRTFEFTRAEVRSEERR